MISGKDTKYKFFSIGIQSQEDVGGTGGRLLDKLGAIGRGYPSRIALMVIPGNQHLVGIHLSRETMEYAPWISPWLSCNACCDCTVQFWSGRPCCSCCRCRQCLALWMLMPPSSIYAVSSASTVLLSSTR